MTKKILYVDMDNVLVDFPSGISHISETLQRKYEGRLDEVPKIFSLMKQISGAIEASEKLSKKYDIYILSTAPWKNSTAWGDKNEWVRKYLGEVANKRLILSYHKNLSMGDYLIDDRTANGADRFQGEHIHFGTEKFPNWDVVCDYLLNENL